jgi:hypothetical protein
VLAIVTAVVDAGGAGHLVSASATLAAYRPALGLITGIAAIGMLVALSGLRRRPAQQVELPGNLGTGNLRVGELTAGGVEAGLVSGERRDGDVAGGPLCREGLTFWRRLGGINTPTALGRSAG